MASSTRLATLSVLLTLCASAAAIRCWKCGQYSEGVGSITPCINRSATQLEECPSNAKFCIKYVSELTIVRDCVPTCKEYESWGARTHCCDTDECNSAPSSPPVGFITVAMATVAAIFAR